MDRSCKGKTRRAEETNRKFGRGDHDQRLPRVHPHMTEHRRQPQVPRRKSVSRGRRGGAVFRPVAGNKGSSDTDVSRYD